MHARTHENYTHCAKAQLHKHSDTTHTRARAHTQARSHAQAQLTSRRQNMRTTHAQHAHNTRASTKHTHLKVAVHRVPRVCDIRRGPEDVVGAIAHVCGARARRVPRSVGRNRSAPAQPARLGPCATNRASSQRSRSGVLREHHFYLKHRHRPAAARQDRLGGERRVFAVLICARQSWRTGLLLPVAVLNHDRTARFVQQLRPPREIAKLPAALLQQFNSCNAA